MRKIILASYPPFGVTSHSPGLIGKGIVSKKDSMSQWERETSDLSRVKAEVTRERLLP
jgi:hypothetical protein